MALPPFFANLLSIQGGNLLNNPSISGLSPIPQTSTMGQLAPKQLGPLGRFRQGFANNAALIGPALGQILTSTNSDQIQKALQTLSSSRQAELERQFSTEEREKDRKAAIEAQNKDLEASSERLKSELDARLKVVESEISSREKIAGEEISFDRDRLEQTLAADRDARREEFTFRHNEAGLTRDQSERLFFQEEANRFKQELLPLVGTLNPATGDILVDTQNINNISEAMARNDFTDIDESTIGLIGAANAIKNLKLSADSSEDIFKAGLDFLSTNIDRVIINPDNGLPEIDASTGKPKTVPLSTGEKMSIYNAAAISQGVAPIFTEDFISSASPATDEFGNTEEDLRAVQDIQSGTEAATNNEEVKSLFLAAETDQQTIAVAALMADSRGGGLGPEGMKEFIESADYLTIQQKKVLRDYAASLIQNSLPRGLDLRALTEGSLPVR